MSYWRYCRTTHPTARKKHRCSLCGGRIRVGQTYERTRGKYDGKWSTQKNCGRCVMGEENVYGAWVRPEDVLEKVLDGNGCLPAECHFDGHELTMFGLAFDDTGRERLAVHQAEIIPGVGLTEWTTVAIQRRRGIGWREVEGGSS